MKKVLFLYIKFYEYISAIANAMTDNGFDVTLFPIDVELSLYEKIKCRLKPDLRKQKYIQIHNQTLNDIVSKNGSFDYVFVLVGRNLEKNILEELKTKYCSAQFILYMWDDVARIESIHRLFCYFDKIITFDQEDSKKYGFRHLPLFYTKDYLFDNSCDKKNIDLYVSGGLHSGRLDILYYYYKYSKKLSLNLFAYMAFGCFSDFCCHFNNFKFLSLLRFIHNSQITMNYNSSLCKKSKTIIDVQHVSQIGLTIRTIEALASQCKLITTNEFIKEYDFYCPENIMVIDRENPLFDADWIRAPYKPVSKEIVEKYSLENWVKQIFSDN